VKPIAKQSNKKAAFTIVELLTVMSIIIILIGLLVPGLNQIKRFAKRVKQKAQFHSIGIALDFFNTEWDGYPPSEALDGANRPYCGAMKLAEAMVGKDLWGFNPDSVFAAGNPVPPAPPLYHDTITLPGRKQYLKLEGANVETIGKLYSTQPFDPCEVVLCDVYAHRTASGERKGMPILYYRANTSKTLHLPPPAPPSENIYNYDDNRELTEILQTYDGEDHLLNPVTFYEEIRNEKINIPRPFRADSYILISAGHDGKYGTKHDVFNFGN
jgi:type II secretory pathway pseudopilin PulG